MMDPLGALLFDNAAMSVTDIDFSIAWYGRVFGFKPVHRAYFASLQADFVILERPGLKIELLSRTSTVRNPAAAIMPGLHMDTTGLKAIVFRTTDLAGITKHLEQEHVAFEWKMKILSDDGMTATMIRDPDGTLINILQYPAEAG